MKRREFGALTATAIAVIAVAILAGRSANASETINYTYDARGRLVRVERRGTVNDNVRADYHYDKGDNRTDVNVISPNNSQ